jgi:hypothetical protein
MEKLTREEKICCTARLTPFIPPMTTYAPIILIRKNEKAMGNPMDRKMRSPPINNKTILQVSI